MSSVITVTAFVLILPNVICSILSNSANLAHIAVPITDTVYLNWYDVRQPINGQMNSADQESIAADLRAIRQRYDDLVATDSYQFTSILNMMRGISNDIALLGDMDVLIKYIRKATTSYDRMQRYFHNREKYEEETLYNFARSCVSYRSQSLPMIIEHVHNILNSNYSIKSTFMGKLHFTLKEGTLANICLFQDSANNMVYNLLRAIITSEIRSFITMRYAWILLKIYGHGNFKEEIKTARIKHLFRINGTMLIFKDLLATTSTEIYRCDPDEPSEGTTYERITQFLQGYIDNEVNIEESGKCIWNCNALKSTKQFRCVKDTLCEKQASCDGTLRSCRQIVQGADPTLTLCSAPEHSGKLYDWIRINNNSPNYGNCRSKSYRMIGSWRNLLLQECTYCVCICDDKKPESERYISLNEETSDVASNKKVNRVIHLQIIEAELGPKGTITIDRQWKQINQTIDYCELSYDERGIVLEEFEGNDANVLTGVRFKKVDTKIHFQIRITEFDYETGRLLPKKNSWLYSNKIKSMINMENLDVPIKTQWKSTPYSVPGQYLNFHHSDFQNDLAQTTIPFIDVQSVIPMEPVLLSGAGLHYKKSPGFGGYIAPKIFTYKHVIRD